MGTNKKLQPTIFPKYINKYTVTLLCFIAWIGFIDTHNLFTQHKLKQIIGDMEKEKKELHVMYEEALEEKKLLESDQERYAREKYFMHKDNEEVFIIKQKEEE